MTKNSNFQLTYLPILSDIVSYVAVIKLFIMFSYN